MVVVSVGGLAVSAFHQNTSFSKAPVSIPRRLFRNSNSVFQKAPLADIQTSMLRFWLEASFCSFRK
jgi:hypothetical protein